MKLYFNAYSGYSSSKFLQQYFYTYFSNNLRISDSFTTRKDSKKLLSCSVCEPSSAKCQSALKESRIEYYRQNIGPGTYEIQSDLSQKVLGYSFFKTPKFEGKSDKTPGVGNYSPKITSRAVPRCIIGTSTKGNDYWEIRRNKRSPGPIYKYTLPNESTSKYRLNCVVNSIKI